MALKIEKAKTMNKIISAGLCILLYFPLLLHAQQETGPDIGIVEHLGETLPANLSFVNEKNETVLLKNLITKPTVLTLVYFDCPGICSPLLDGVSDVIEKSDLVLGKDYQVLTISFNTSDTPEKAVEKKKNFLKKHSKSHAGGWMYLTGDSANINGIVNAVGFKYKKTGVDYAHAACITVISPGSKITRYLYGISFLPFDLKMAIVESQKEQARPSINRVLEFCFSYDPRGKKYVLDITRITGTIILFIALVVFITLVVRSRKKKQLKSNLN